MWLWSYLVVSKLALQCLIVMFDECARVCVMMCMPDKQEGFSCACGPTWW